MHKTTSFCYSLHSESTLVEFVNTNVTDPFATAAIVTKLAFLSWLLQLHYIVCVHWQIADWEWFIIPMKNKLICRRKQIEDTNTFDSVDDAASQVHSSEALNDDKSSNLISSVWRHSKEEKQRWSELQFMRKINRDGKWWDIDSTSTFD